MGGVNFQRPADTGSGSGEYVEGVGLQQELMPSVRHVPDGETVVYNTTPPTSGDMLARPALCGFYEDGLADEQIVHNLEHGNIVLSYNLSTEEEADQLRNVLDGVGLSEIWGVTRAYDKIPAGTVESSDSSDGSVLMFHAKEHLRMGLV